MTYTPLPGALSADDIGGFIADQGILTDLGFTYVEGRFGVSLPSQPDRIVIVTMTGGPGLSSDGAFDQRTAQIRVRGGQNDADSAWEMASAIDGMFVPPIGYPPLLGGMMGSQYVNKVTRQGSPPAFFTYDSARRTHIVAAYQFAVGRATVTL